MSTHRTARQGLALASLVLAACGGFESKPEPRPASSFAATESASRGDECGTAERPCVLQEIRVTAAVAN